MHLISFTIHAFPACILYVCRICFLGWSFSRLPTEKPVSTKGGFTFDKSLKSWQKEVWSRIKCRANIYIVCISLQKCRHLVPFDWEKNSKNRFWDGKSVNINRPKLLYTGNDKIFPRPPTLNKSVLFNMNNAKEMSQACYIIVLYVWQ